MELKVKTPTFPEIISFNYEELKQEIANKTSYYMNLVYTEDQIQDAKKDRANLNKFVKAMSDERIKIKKECLKPYDDFEKKIKELDGIVNSAIQNIDSQVKEYEEKKKAEKLEKIKEYWLEVLAADKVPASITFDQIFNEKWLNASVSIKTVQEEITARLEQIASDLETLSKLPDFSFEATEEYKRSLDLAKAISEGQRLAEIQKRKEEAALKEQEAKIAAANVVPTANIDGQEVPLAEIPVEVPEKTWISFKALLSVDDATALKNFFESRNIEFQAI